MNFSLFAFYIWNTLTKCYKLTEKEVIRNMVVLRLPWDLLKHRTIVQQLFICFLSASFGIKIKMKFM